MHKYRFDFEKVSDEGGVTPDAFLASPDTALFPNGKNPDEEGRILLGCLSGFDRNDPQISCWFAVQDDADTFKVEYVPILTDNDDNPVVGESVKLSREYHSVEDAADMLIEMLCEHGSRSVFYPIIVEEAHSILAGYCEPAQLSFEEFKDKLANVSDWNEQAHRITRTKVANAMLCLRYPFLIPWPVMNDDIPWSYRDEMFDYTVLDQFPEGWSRRFGLELCEDIRNQAWHPDQRIWKARLREIRTDDTKEKWGSLRTYWSVYGRGQDLLDAYECFSEVVCINCGTADRTRITSGYIVPCCVKHVISEKKISRKQEQELIEKILGKGKHPWGDEQEVLQFNKFASTLASTSYATTSESMATMLDSWTITSYSLEGTKKLNKSIGLLDGSTAPNGEPIHAREVLLGILDDVRELEAWVMAGYPDDSGYGMSYGAFADEHNLKLPDWWEEKRQR